MVVLEGLPTEDRCDWPRGTCLVAGWGLRAQVGTVVKAQGREALGGKMAPVGAIPVPWAPGHGWVVGTWLHQ